MLNNPFFYSTIVLGGALAYALGHNITTGKDLAHALGAEWKAKLAQWRAMRKAGVKVQS